MKTNHFGEQSSKGQLEPSIAGVLSLVPGLGQFYNGDRLKGWLFLEVGAINFMILMLILCADSLSTGLAQFAVNHHFNANYALLKQLAQFKLGHPGATLLFTLCLAFIAFSVRDAYDRATNIKNREIYAGHFLELSEATSGSYLAHFALMGALLLLSVFLLIPAPPRTQVTEIEFVAQPETRVKPPVTNRISTNNSRAQAEHRRNVPVRTNRGETTPTQPSASRSAQQTTAAKPQPKPEVKTQAADAPKPAPVKVHEAPKPPAPVTTPLPIVRPPAPTPVAVTPAPTPPMPTRPMPIAPANFVAPPTPMASSLKPMPAKTIAGAAFARPNSVPFANGVVAAPRPLLAFNSSGTAASALPTLSTAPVGTSSSSSNNHSWMSGRTPSTGKSGTGPAAPSVDTSSFTGRGDSHLKPTLADTSSGRTGPGKGSSHGEAPKPIAAKSGLGPGTMVILVPQTNARPGDPNGGRANSDPTTTGKGVPAVDGVKKEAEFGKYLADLQRRIRRAWMPPRQPNSKSSIVVFTIGLNGELLGLHLQRSSGESAMDEAAIQSIRNSAPFPHLPPYSPDSVDVQFTFDYNVFGGGAGGRRF
ncbi:MAG: hypothetical protein C0469_14745 [Cyanobacteria bacterium DS2.3.42]|nr:hypothetical protein [Cyanobacteria bacterium DS2.3.42]